MSEYKGLFFKVDIAECQSGWVWQVKNTNGDFLGCEDFNLGSKEEAIEEAQGFIDILLSPPSLI